MILECTRNEPATRTRVALGIFAITMMLAMPLACGGDASVFPASLSALSNHTL